MKHTQDEIISALTVIKETCAEFGKAPAGLFTDSACLNCPLYVGDECRIVEGECAPRYWQLNDGTCTVWRAFT